MIRTTPRRRRGTGPTTFGVVPAWEPCTGARLSYPRLRLRREPLWSDVFLAAGPVTTPPAVARPAVARPAAVARPEPTRPDAKERAALRSARRLDNFERDGADRTASSARSDRRAARRAANFERLGAGRPPGVSRRAGADRPAGADRRGDADRRDGAGRRAGAVWPDRTGRPAEILRSDRRAARRAANFDRLGAGRAAGADRTERPPLTVRLEAMVRWAGARRRDTTVRPDPSPRRRPRRTVTDGGRA